MSFQRTGSRIIQRRQMPWNGSSSQRIRRQSNAFWAWWDTFRNFLLICQRSRHLFDSTWRGKMIISVRIQTYKVQHLQTSRECCVNHRFYGTLIRKPRGRHHAYTIDAPDFRSGVCLINDGQSVQHASTALAEAECKLYTDRERNTGDRIQVRQIWEIRIR